MMDNKSPEQVVQEFLDKMRTQDNRATASPFYYTIRTANWVASYHQDEGDRYAFVEKDCYESVEYAEYKKDFYKIFAEQNDMLITGEDDDGDGYNIYDVECAVEDKYNIFAEKKEWKYECMFLTETDAENHLKRNDYHYSADARTYVKHAWRAPELKEFIDALYKLYPQKESS